MKTLLISLYPYNRLERLDYWHDHGAGMTFTAARNACCDIDFLDMKGLRNDSELRERIKGYDLISFGLKSSYFPIALRVIAMAKAQGSKVIVGGYHVTAAPNELLEISNIDYVFHGESEITFPKFLKDPQSFSREIFGEKPCNLDNLPFMDRELFINPLEDCSGWWYGTCFTKLTTVVSARGCPYKCGFCQPIEDNHFGKALRRRSVNSLIDELRLIKKLYNPECVMIHDDTFFLQSNWLEEFIERYPEIGLPFWASARADGICTKPDLFRRLVKVGWDLVSVGFESGSQRILDKLSKGTTVEQNLEAAKIIKCSGAKIYANYIIGMPWETKWDTQATAKMIDIIDAEMPRHAFYAPYPGTTLTDECLSNNWSLLTKNTYNRSPRGKKVTNVDYDYVHEVWQKGFRETLRQETCDIIVPTYNNEDFTLACFKSIKRYTRPGTYRIIWVDNGSKDTCKVEEILQDVTHIAIKLTKNEGFVGAVNKGLLASTASTICLLNNDTVVSPKWLYKLMLTLYKDKELGIIGPLTKERTGPNVDSLNSLTLHPGIIPKKLGLMSLLDTNKYLESHYRGKTVPISYVAFLCAVIKREVFDKVGFIDTNFEMGLYDDQDYCYAVHKLGYKTELALDTCIYHKGRSTFDLIQKEECLDVKSLLSKNLTYLNQKWKTG
jgi:radical SAM superfamily enzyme YgiQ (UPF0313 family)